MMEDLVPGWGNFKTYKNNININSKYIMPESIYEVGSKNYLLKNMAQNKKLF